MPKADKAQHNCDRDVAARLKTTLADWETATVATRGGRGDDDYFSFLEHHFPIAPPKRAETASEARLPQAHATSCRVVGLARQAAVAHLVAAVQPQKRSLARLHADGAAEASTC